MFDSDAPWRLSPRVGLRPEPFGALAYHYDTRRLVFLKAPELVALVRDLDQHATAAAAVEARVDDQRRHPTFLAGLRSLAEAGVVEPRPTATLPETA